MKIIGLDLDNTIICYKGVFHRVALQQRLIPPDLPEGKDDVRDHLRSVGREDDWTRLQGYVYGPGLSEAQPYPGLPAFLDGARAAGWRVLVISHKTRTPYLGPPYDLQQSARDWLAARGVLAPGPGGIRPDEVFLEESKADKLRRIAETGCRVFVDDLPEFLAEPSFPSGVRRVLFDPDSRATPDPRWSAVSGWAEVLALLRGFA